MHDLKVNVGNKTIDFNLL